MKLKTCVFLFSLFLSASFLFAQNHSEVKMNIGGVYTAWGQMQNDFKLGNGEYQDHYIVQMMRLNLAFNYEDKVKAITRFDLGQGWWGVDNQPPSYENGGSGLFDNKGTQFFLHVDQAYVWFKVPGTPASMNVGRFNWTLGNKLVLNNNLDGISVKFGLKKSSISLGWAKLWEGVNGLSDVEPEEGSPVDARDANLFTAVYNFKMNSSNFELYGLYYNDASTEDGTAYIPDGLYFNRPRFTPQVTQLFTFGLAGKSNLDKISLEYEANYLMGKDDIDNQSFAGPLNTSASGTDPLKYDKNNGDLSGYNAYVRFNYAVSDAFKLGAFAGIGSGDDDPTQGEGNVNKLRTSGFFYLTEVWEDSIMPDEEGITPQGLGAPNIRAYRELENTTALQLNGTVKLTDKWSFYSAFTYLMATEPIYAWTAEGPDLDRSADDIGWEIDFKTDYKLYKNLTATFRGGYFAPGVGAQYLINGTDEYDKAPWELKTTITYKF